MGRKWKNKPGKQGTLAPGVILGADGKPIAQDVLRYNALVAAEKQAKKDEKIARKEAEIFKQRLDAAALEKDKATALVKKMQQNPEATKQEKDAADAAYKLAAARWIAVRNGKIFVEPGEVNESATDAVPNPDDVEVPADQEVVTENTHS